MTSTASTDTTAEDQQPPSPAESTSALGAREQLRWFVTLWVMAMSLHYTDSQPRAAIPILLAGLPALFFPSSLWAFGLFAVAALIMGVLSLPSAANHIILSLLVSVTFGLAALCVLVARKRAGSSRGPGSETFVERLLETARTPICLTLLVVYLFTVFHKLNSAFFDGTVSCAGSLLSQMIGMNGLGKVTLNPNAVLAAAIGTVAIETAILVLLAVPRLRAWGLALGVGFHLVLAPASFYDFATMVYAIYIMFVPTRVFAALSERPGMRTARRVALAAFAVHMVLSIEVDFVGTSISGFGLPWHTLRVLTWYVVLVPLMFPLVATCFADRATGARWPGWRLGGRGGAVVLLLIPLLAFVNGLAPYLGFKTVASYSMFSNLHTERGATNHFLGALTHLQVVPYERDAVTVTAVQMPQMRNMHGQTVSLARASRWTSEDAPVVVPWLELRRTVHLWMDFGISGIRVEYTRDGVARVAPDATKDPELAAPMPWWQRHLLAFRAADSGSGTDICRW